MTTEEYAIVGVTETCKRLKKFTGPNALRRAEKYVGTLPDCEKGIYYIDWPCGKELEE